MKFREGTCSSCKREIQIKVSDGRCLCCRGKCACIVACPRRERSVQAVVGFCGTVAQQVWSR